MGEITFDMALSSGSQLKVVDMSGLQPLQFAAPSPDAVERFVSAMGAEPAERSNPLRFAAASLSIEDETSAPLVERAYPPEAEGRSRLQASSMRGARAFTGASRTGESPVLLNKASRVEEPVSEKTVVVDLSQEAAKVATAQAVPAAPQAIDVQSAAASTASARTETITETVGKVVEAVAAQILVTPSLVKGEGEMIVRLKSDVLDGSTIRLTSESGTLSVEIAPATNSVQRTIVAAAPRLEAALTEHVAVASFHHVRVLVKKGKNEAV